MALKVVLKDTYKKVNQATNRRETRYMWTVTGAPKDIERFQEEQGENFRADDQGRPLFFNKEFPGTRNAELARVALQDGTIIYKISMLEKTLAIEGLKMNELAKLEAQAEFYGNGAQQPAAPIRPTVGAPNAAAEEVEEGAAPIAGAGGAEQLGDGM